MRHLYNEASPEQQDDFLDAVLEPLFTAIDTNRSADNYLYDTKVSGRLRVPYLNGGLFERNADDEIPSRFPKEYFSDLLEFFSQYNTQAVFRDGMLMEIHSWSYPWGPEEP